MGLYQGYIRVIFGLYWGDIRVILGLYQGYIRVILGLYWGYIGVGPRFQDWNSGLRDGWTPRLMSGIIQWYL